MITKEGYLKILELDSKRDIKVILKLMELGALNGEVMIKQIDLANALGLKNQANINNSIQNLIKNRFISKTENMGMYYINPEFYTTQKGYKKALKDFNDNIKVEIPDELFSIFSGGDTL